jgi:hypothetical protein
MDPLYYTSCLFLFTNRLFKKKPAKTLLNKKSAKTLLNKKSLQKGSQIIVFGSKYNYHIKYNDCIPYNISCQGYADI